MQYSTRYIPVWYKYNVVTTCTYRSGLHLGGGGAFVKKQLLHAGSYKLMHNHHKMFPISIITIGLVLHFLNVLQNISRVSCIDPYSGWQVFEMSSWLVRVESSVEYTSTGPLESSTSTGALEYEYERSSTQVQGVRSSSEARVRVLECSSFTH